MADQNQRISDLLDTLTDASSEEIETALRIYEPADVAAVVAERALAGGGGSGGSSSFTETVTITPQADTPALQASQVGGAEAAEFIADPDSGTAALVKVLSKAGNGIRLIDQFGGIQAAPDPETPFASLSAGADSGQTSNVLECWDNDFNNVVLATTPAGAVMMPHLPTADPHAVGQLWNASGVLTISAG